jgi:hypothetical protein
MQVNILKALDAQESIRQEIMRLKSYIDKEPEGQLKEGLSALLAGLEAARSGIYKEVEAAVVVIPKEVEKYIKAEDVIKEVVKK